MKYFEIKLDNKNYRRFHKYYQSIINQNDKNLTKHWSKREKKNYESFIFSKNNSIRINKDNNTGLDDNYEECFNKKNINQNLLFKQKIKKFLYKCLNINIGINFQARLNFINSVNCNPIKISFIDKEFGKNRKDFTIYKSIFILNDLINSVTNIDINNKKIIEIGPGVGNLIRTISTNFNNNKYYLVDLDISLLFSILNIINRFPNANYLLPNELNEYDNSKRYNFIFLSTSQINFIKKNSIDIAFNTMSFQEMSLDEINKYFILLRKILKKNNLFYCMNAVEKEMIINDHKYFVRFSEYPWKIDDEITVYNLSEVHKNKTTKPFFRKIVRLKTNE